MSRKSLALITGLLGLVLGGPASAQPKPKPACNIKALPFVQGTELIYKAVAPPGMTQPSQPLPKPKQPAIVKIEVVSVTTEGVGKEQKTTIQLKESADDRVYESTVTCKKDQIFVQPQSFFFSGEPGGGLGITLGELTRGEDSQASYMFQQGKMIIPEWIENLKVPFTRTAAEGTKAKLVDGSLDMQRVIMIGLPEEVTTEMGTFSATPLQVDLRGSVILNVAPEPKEFNIPANTISKMWFAENVGMVQVFNTNLHMYQLAEVKRPEPAAPPK